MVPITPFSEISGGGAIYFTNMNNIDNTVFVLERIRKILLLKLSMMHKDKSFYKKIFLNLLIPKRNILMPIQLYKSIDQIWFMAGDTSTDFNFYTKRLILGGIYTRVVLFFFNNGISVFYFLF